MTFLWTKKCQTLFISNNTSTKFVISIFDKRNKYNFDLY